jgi:hypothetical protein
MKWKIAYNGKDGCRGERSVQDGGWRLRPEERFALQQA